MGLTGSFDVKNYSAVWGPTLIRAVFTKMEMTVQQAGLWEEIGSFIWIYYICVTS